MQLPSINDRVKLIHDIPTLSLHRGDWGVVQSVWFAETSTTAFEVEFPSTDPETPCRALLSCNDVELQEAAANQTAVPL